MTPNEIIAISGAVIAIAGLIVTIYGTFSKTTKLISSLAVSFNDTIKESQRNAQHESEELNSQISELHKIVDDLVTANTRQTEEIQRITETMMKVTENFERTNSGLKEDLHHARETYGANYERASDAYIRLAEYLGHGHNGKNGGATASVTIDK